MAIDFPSSPSVNDSFTSGGKTWVWNGTYWKLYGSVLRGLSLAISDTPPASPVSGDMWYESDTGRTFTYYDGAWVELGNTAAVTAFLTDADGDTIVHVEEGTDDDTIRFDTAGSERMTIDASGDVTIGGNLAVGSNTDVEASIDAVEADVSNINELQQNEQTGTTYTLVLADGGKLVEMNNASANTLTVPPNSSVAFPVGSQILVLQTGAGQTTLAPDTGVTINSKDGNLKLSDQWCGVTLIKRATDVWVAIGDLSA
jgi:hypothetical protein